MNYSTFSDVINPQNVEVRDFSVLETGSFISGPAFLLPKANFLFCLGVNSGNGPGTTEWNYAFQLTRLYYDVLDEDWYDDLLPEANYLYTRRFASYPTQLCHQYAYVRIDDPGYYMVTMVHSVLTGNWASVTLSFVEIA